MAANLLEMFNLTLGDNIVKQASSILGESAESTHMAVRSTASILLGALSYKSQSDAGARDLMNYFTEHKIDGNNLNQVSALLSDDQQIEKISSVGAGHLKYLFGEKLTQVIDMVSGSSGLKTSSASYILKLVSPFLLGVVAKYIREKSLDGYAVKNLLQGQGEYIISTLPKGMMESFGWEQVSTTGTGASPYSSSVHTEKTTLSKLLPWVVLVMTALGLFYFVEKGCGPNSAPSEKNQTESPADSVR